jgi:hypothetical protein
MNTYYIDNHVTETFTIPKCEMRARALTIGDFRDIRINPSNQLQTFQLALIRCPSR